MPAETPLVAGIISLTPSTPNSHTAILAKSFGIPFVHLPEAADRARAQALIGHKVILRATVEFDAGLVKLIDLGDGLDPAVETELLALKQPVPIEYTPKAAFGAISASTQNLCRRTSGSSAARRQITGFSVAPCRTTARRRLRFPLTCGTRFSISRLPNNSTLRAEIAARLAAAFDLSAADRGHEIIARGHSHADHHSAQFTPSQKQAIITALTGFTPGRKIRFRSSTNVEDSATFTGAGLYDSYSGCLLDDLDGDSAGPCACEPGEPHGTRCLPRHPARLCQLLQ